MMSNQSLILILTDILALIVFIINEYWTKALYTYHTQTLPLFYTLRQNVCLIWVRWNHTGMEWRFLHHYPSYFKGRSMQTNRRLLTSRRAKLNIPGHSAHSLRFPDGTKSQPHKSWKQLGTRCNSQWGRWFRSRAIIRVKYVLTV